MKMFQRVPEAPTNPQKPLKANQRFDVGDLYDDAAGSGVTTDTGLDEKLRQAYLRVKIIDEYNRIPTRTQSALLTVLADNYAEILDQTYECPESAWYLTANDDAGGGTYQVIEALRDRIDIVIRALHFNTRFLGDLQRRIEHRFHPEQMVPKEIIFTDEEISAAQSRILAIVLPRPVRSRLEFFCRHFEFFEPASPVLEYMTKDTAKLSGLDFRTLARRCESGGHSHLLTFCRVKVSVTFCLL